MDQDLIAFVISHLRSKSASLIRWGRSLLGKSFIS